MAGYQNLLDLIRDGEAVRAATPNRPLRQLDGNVRYLKDILETALAGQAIIIRDATLAESVQAGQPAYFNSGNLRFEQALGATEIDPETGFLRTATSANIAGVVSRKLSSDRGDVLVAGLADVDLSASVLGIVAPGVYYLSPQFPGRLTAVAPPTGLPVLQVLQPGAASGQWQVLLKPQFNDYVGEHRHYDYELSIYPAGEHEPPTLGDPHVITSPDDEIEGWLPADDAIFDGKAPAGAKFGYNLSVCPLGAIWPPIPLSSAKVSACRPSDFGDDKVRGAEILTEDHVKIDEYGLWWMSNCYDEVPWPATYDSDDAVSAGDPDDCPTPKTDRMFLHWVHAGGRTENGAVLSLRGREGSGLVFYCRNTDDVKDVGHLEADFDLGLIMSPDPVGGHEVFKTFEDGLFHRGPVVESVRSASPVLSVTSNVVLGPGGRAYGEVVLQADLDVSNSEFPVETVRLNGVEEEFHKEVLALGFPSSRASDLRGRIAVPGRVELPPGTQMRIRMLMLARVTGTVPNDVFTLTYRIIPRPATVLTPVALPTSETSLALPSGVTLTRDYYYLMESEAFEIAAGDEVLFTLGRAAPDAYGGELHALRIWGSPEPGA